MSGAVHTVKFGIYEHRLVAGDIFVEIETQPNTEPGVQEFKISCNTEGLIILEGVLQDLRESMFALNVLRFPTGIRSLQAENDAAFAKEAAVVDEPQTYKDYPLRPEFSKPTDETVTLETFDGRLIDKIVQRTKGSANPSYRVPTKESVYDPMHGPKKTKRVKFANGGPIIGLEGYLH